MYNFHDFDIVKIKSHDRRHFDLFWTQLKRITLVAIWKSRHLPQHVFHTADVVRSLSSNGLSVRHHHPNPMRTWPVSVFVPILIVIVYFVDGGVVKHAGRKEKRESVIKLLTYFDASRRGYCTLASRRRDWCDVFRRPSSMCFGEAFSSLRSSRRQRHHTTASPSCKVLSLKVDLFHAARSGQWIGSKFFIIIEK